MGFTRMKLYGLCREKGKCQPGCGLCAHITHGRGKATGRPKLVFVQLSMDDLIKTKGVTR